MGVGDVADMTYDSEKPRAVEATAEAVAVDKYTEIRERVAAAEAEGHYGYEEQARADVLALLDEVERLRKALGFYANNRNWVLTLKDVARGRDSRVQDDGGSRAREALK